MLRLLFEFVMFATSTGVFFNEEFRKNSVAVLAAGLIAVASTISLFASLNDFLQLPKTLTETSNRKSAETQPAPPPPPQKLCVTFNGRQICE